MTENYIKGFAIITPYSYRTDELFRDIKRISGHPMTEIAMTLGGDIFVQFEGEKDNIQAYLKERIFPLKLVRQIKPLSALEMKLMTKDAKS